MKVLFVCLDDYPYSGACTKLLNNLLFDGNLKQSFDEVHVISNDRTNGVRKSFIYNGIKIHPVPVWSSFSLKKIKEIAFVRMGFALSIIAHKIGNRILKLINPAFFYNYFDSLTIGKEIDSVVSKESIDIIIPIAGYFSSIAASLKIKREEIRVFPYLVDPCSTNETFPVGKKKGCKQLERKMSEKGEKIIVTPLIFEEFNKGITGFTKNNLLKMEFPSVVKKQIRPGSKTIKDSIDIVFCGRLYAGRNIYYFLELLDLLPDLDIHFKMVGVSEKEVDISVITMRVELLGYQTLDNCEWYLNNADFLVNFGNSMLNQVPSKVFDYISRGIPIINVCKTKDCPSIPYIKKYPYAINLIEDPSLVLEQKSELYEFIVNTLNRRCSAEEIEKTYKECTPDYCAKMINTFLEKKENE